MFCSFCLMLFVMFCSRTKSVFANKITKKNVLLSLLFYQKLKTVLSGTILIVPNKKSTRNAMGKGRESKR